MELTNEWAKSFPSEAGVYVVFEDKEVVYVGEAKNIQERMKDLLDSRNHTLRRSIGREKYSKSKGYKNANTDNKFPKPIEKKVIKWMKENLKICALPVDLGRKELEGKIMEKNPKYNKKGKSIKKKQNNLSINE